MGMGYGASFAEIIEEESVKKFCPKELNAFKTALEQSEEDIGEVARGLGQGENIDDNVSKQYAKLIQAFKKKTGLYVYVDFHSRQDEGDRYDEVDGMYFAVGGMYQLSKAGKKMEKYVTRKFFVTYG